MSIFSDNMDWVSHLPAGWHALYRQLVADIAELDGNIRVVQAKQKFGELRVYVDRHDDRVYALKRAASTASKAMCEQCGAAGQVTVDPSGYYATLCKTHASGAKPTASPLISLTLIVPKRP